MDSDHYKTSLSLVTRPVCTVLPAVSIARLACLFGFSTLYIPLLSAVAS